MRKVQFPFFHSLKTLLSYKYSYFNHYHYTYEYPCMYVFCVYINIYVYIYIYIHTIYMDICIYKPNFVRNTVKLENKRLQLIVFLVLKLQRGTKS